MPYRNNLTELLYNRVTIVEILSHHLKKKGSLCLESLFNLTSVLAKDLRQEFYTVFKDQSDLFQTLVDRIDPIEPEESEMAFQCLAYIFKYLSKYIVKDLAFWFEKYSQLIGHRKWYIRKFAAESFAFLVQKLNSEGLAVYFAKIFEKLNENPHPIMYDGTSILFFETMKGVYGHFHSTMPKMMPLLFRHLDRSNCKSDKELQHKFLLIQKTIELLCHHSLNKSVSEHLWKCLDEEMNHLMSRWNKAKTVELGLQFGHIATLLVEVINKDVCREKILMGCVKRLIENPLSSPITPAEGKKAILALVEHVLLVSRGELLIQMINEFSIMKVILEIKEVIVVTEFFKNVVQNVFSIEKKSLSNDKEAFVKMILKYVSLSFVSNMDQSLSFLVELLMRQGKFKEENVELNQKVLETLKKHVGLIMNGNFEKLIGSVETDETTLQPWVVWTCVLYCGAVSSAPKQYLVETLEEFVDKADKLFLKAPFEPSLEFVKILSELIKSSAEAFGTDSIGLSKLFSQTAPRIIQHFSAQPLIVQALKHCAEKITTKIDIDYNSVWSNLKTNLGSKNNLLRLYTLQLLTKLPGVLTKNKAKWTILPHLLAIEECGTNFEQERAKLYALHKAIDDTAREGKDFEPIHFEMISHYIIGGYFIKYAEVWPLIQKFALIVCRYESQVFWDVFHEELMFWHKFDLTNEVPKEKPFIYTRRKEKIHKINFGNYDQIFKAEKITLEDIFFKTLIEEFEHTDYIQYFANIWGLLTEMTVTKKMYPGVLSIWREFAKHYHLDTDGLKKFESRAKVTIRLRGFLSLLNKFDAKVFTDELMSDMMSIIITNNIEVQVLALGIISKFNLPWFTPYSAGIKALVNYQTKPSVFKKLPIRAIKQEHRSDLIPFLVALLAPSMKPKKHASRTEELEWKASTKAILEYFAPLKPEERDLFIKTLIPSKDAVKSRGDQRLKWILSIVDQVVRLTDESYSFAYDDIVDLLVFIATRDAKSDPEVEEDEDVMEEEEKEVPEPTGEDVMDVVEGDEPEKKKINPRQAKSIHLLHRDVKQTAISLLATFFKRHPDHPYSMEIIEQIVDALQWNLSVIKNNVKTLPKILQLLFAWDNTVSASYLRQFPKLLSGLIELIADESIVTKCLMPILEYIESIISIKGEELVTPANFEMKSLSVNKALLQPITDKLVNALWSAISQEHLSPVKRRMTRIIHSLSDNFSEKTTNPDIVVSVYAEGLDGESFENSLEMVKKWISKASKEVKSKYVKSFSMNFAQQKDPRVRNLICEIFAGIDNKSGGIYQLLISLNSYSASMLDKMDMESRFEAFQSIIDMEDSIKGFDDMMLLPVVANLCFFTTNSQWIIRDNASKAIQSVIRWVYTSKGYPEVKLMINDHLAALVSGTEIVKSNVITPMIAELFKSNPAYKDLKTYESLLLTLSEEDIEKKCAAVLEFGSKWKLAKSLDAVFALVMPIFYSFLLTTDVNMRNAVLTTLHNIAKKLPWDYYAEILNYLITTFAHKRVFSDRKVQSQILNLLCNLIEEWAKKDQSRNRNVVDYFVRTVIPQLYDHMWANESMVRMDIAVLIVKVLKNYNPKELDFQISRICLELIGKLKDRKNEAQRESARAALIAVLKELGADYFGIVLENLNRMLNEGYMISILHFTVLGLLRALKSEIKGNIDDTENTLPVLLDILLNDIAKPLPMQSSHFAIMEKKDVYTYHTTFESFAVLGTLIKPESIDFIITRIEYLLVHVIDQDVTKRFITLLESFARGLRSNKLSDEFIVSFVKYKLEQKSFENLEFEVEPEDTIFAAPKKYVDKNKETFEIPEEPSRQGALSLIDIKRIKKFAKKRDKNDHLIVHFVLTLLEDNVRRGVITKSLEEFVPILLKYISGKNLQIALLSLKIMVLIQKNKLAYNVNQQELINCLFELLLNTGVDSKGEVWDTLFASIRHFLVDDKMKFTDHQLNIIFDTLKIEVNGQEYNEKPFGVLSLLVSRGIIVPQVYDIAHRLETIMLITSGTVQDHAIMTLSNFFLHYPMTSDVLQGHFDFLFKNMLNDKLSPMSRQALVKMIHTIVIKFPSQFINDKVEYFLLPMMVSVTNDADMREKMIEVVLELLKKLTSKNFDKIIQLCIKWIKLPKFRNIGTELISIAMRISNGAKLLHILPGLFKDHLFALINESEFCTNPLKIMYQAIECGLLDVKMFYDVSDTLSKYLLNQSEEIRYNVLKSLAFLTKSDYPVNETTINGLLQNLMARNLNDETSSFIQQSLVQIMKRGETEAIMKGLEEMSLYLEDNYDPKTVSVRRKAILTLFIAYVQIVKEEAVLSHIVPLLHHIKEKKMSSDLVDRTLFSYNDDVMTAIRKVVGQKELNEAYNNVDQQISEKKQSKKIQTAQQAIINPISFAKKKLRKNSMRADAKKRKRQEKEEPRKK